MFFYIFSIRRFLLRFFWKVGFEIKAWQPRPGGGIRKYEGRNGRRALLVLVPLFTWELSRYLLGYTAEKIQQTFDNQLILILSQFKYHFGVKKIQVTPTKQDYDTSLGFFSDEQPHVFLL